ncbi:hypothetical protein JOE38_002727 [Clavibacter michiganensis]|uniref:MAC/perforin domain-containing protein n=1 Tax=Clavibacter michiganensis TaxID=28447 RepID=UPI00195C2121|nr:MAC/perforin domain-containing protein [Clavibacter michiganensis]MBM7412904.1 hypothetical protein [Clavibacter michiganensis]
MESTNTYLGYGFNIFGRLDLSSGVTEALVVSDGNVVTSPVEDAATIYSRAFSRREDVTEAFAASVGISGSGFAFEGEFSARYGSQSESTENSVYGLYELSLPKATTSLVNHGPGEHSRTFSTDPDVRQLPSRFDATTAERFYRVFQRYGTHFVSMIALGGKLSAYTVSTTSATVSQADAEASVTAQYDGLFSTSAEAHSAWSRVDKGWAASSLTRYTILGGQASIIASMPTGYGDDNGPAVAKWLDSVTGDDQAITDYKLTRISKLFDSEVAAAVDDALDAYFAALIHATVVGVTGFGTTISSSAVGLPNDTRATQPAYSFGALPDSTEPSWVWLLLFDPDTLESVLEADVPGARKTDHGKAYACVPGWEDVINADIDGVRARPGLENPVMVALIEYGQNLHAIPSALQNLSQDCFFDLQGAHSAEHQVMSFIGVPKSGSPAIVTTHFGGERGRSATSVGQYVDGKLAATDQDGDVLSPLAD